MKLYKVTFPAGSFLALPYNWKPEINGHAYTSHRALVEHVVAIEKRMIADAVKTTFPSIRVLNSHAIVSRDSRLQELASSTCPRIR